MACWVFNPITAAWQGISTASSNVSTVAAKSISGTITAGAEIYQVAAGTGINAKVLAQSMIYFIDPGTGDLAGTITAATGSLPDITCAHGNIAASLNAGTTIGNLSASQNITGAIVAGGNIGNITAGGNISGSIVAGGDIGTLMAINANMSANISGNTSAHGSIGNILLCGTLSGYLAAGGSIGVVLVGGNITTYISSGRGPLDITSYGNISGSVSGVDNIVVVANGTVSGDIAAKSGTVAVFAGGSVANGAISAAKNILVMANGDISCPSMKSFAGGVDLTALGAITANATAGTAVSMNAGTINSTANGVSVATQPVDPTAPTGVTPPWTQPLGPPTPLGLSAQTMRALQEQKEFYDLAQRTAKRRFMQVSEGDLGGLPLYNSKVHLFTPYTVTTPEGQKYTVPSLRWVTADGHVAPLDESSLDFLFNEFFYRYPAVAGAIVTGIELIPSAIQIAVGTALIPATGGLSVLLIWDGGDSGRAAIMSYLTGTPEKPLTLQAFQWALGEDAGSVAYVVYEIAMPIGVAKRIAGAGLRIFEGLEEIRLSKVSEGTVMVYRVEGLSNTRVLIGKAGQVAIQGDQTLFLNFGNEARRDAFLAQKLSQDMPGATIKSFEVPESFLSELQRAAVPERMAKMFPGRPIVVDITKAPNQFGLRTPQIKMLRVIVIQGSGKIGR
jgi:hypothetical protein